MLVRIFTLRFSVALDAFDDKPLQEFIKDKVVLSLSEHFFIRNEIPYLVMIVNYEPVQESSPVAATSKKRRSDETWRTLLRDEDMPLYETMRSWRAEYAKKEGLPPYIICNNKELAQIVVTRPQTITALMKIEGFGNGKAEKYGKQILEVLKRTVKEEKTTKNQGKANANT